MKNERKNFLSQLDKACSLDELRPVLNYVIFRDGYAVATDAHILVKSDLELNGFISEEIEQLNGKGIHYSVFKEIFKHHHVTVDNGFFVCYNKKGVKFEYEIDDMSEMKYPDYEQVIPTETKEVSNIALNAKLIEKISKLTMMPKNNKSVVFKFHGANKAVLIRGNSFTFNQELILIMPQMIND